MGDDLPPPLSVETNGDRVVVAINRDGRSVRLPLTPAHTRRPASVLVHAASVVEDRRLLDEETARLEGDAE